jgi:hypothetical protein
MTRPKEVQLSRWHCNARRGRRCLTFYTKLGELPRGKPVSQALRKEWEPKLWSVWCNFAIFGRQTAMTIDPHLRFGHYQAPWPQNVVSSPLQRHEPTFVCQPTVRNLICMAHEATHWCLVRNMHTVRVTLWPIFIVIDPIFPTGPAISPGLQFSPGIYIGRRSRRIPSYHHPHLPLPSPG